MAYRLNEHKPSPEDFIPRYHVQNGATIQLFFDCYYYMPDNAHDPRYHDFINWPSPNYHPGPICQMKPPRDIPVGRPPFMYVGEDTMVPIDFEEEEFSNPSVRWNDATDITSAAYIDNEFSNNTVKVNITANLPTFEKDPVERKFTVFMERPDQNGGTAVDAVVHGILIILPGVKYN